MISIRNATQDDASAIARIYNDSVTNTTAVWNFLTVSAENRAAWIEEKRLAGFPVIVAVEDQKVIGFATYGNFRPQEGYLHTVEHSIYVDKTSRRNGAGKTLVLEIIRIAEKLGKHVMIAAIESSNIPSIKLHEKLGFKHVATFTEVGYKFDRWLDLTCLELRLGSKL